MQNLHDPFTGIYYASYGAHGVELLQMERRILADKEGRLHEFAVATKLTGDPHVPAGQVTFKAKISALDKLSRSSTSATKYPELLGVSFLYKGEGQTAGKGYTNPKWVDGELLVLGVNSMIGEGAPLAFVFSMEESLFDDFGEGPITSSSTSGASGEGTIQEEEDEEEDEEEEHEEDIMDDVNVGFGLNGSGHSPHRKIRKVVMLLHRLDLNRLKGKEPSA
jgi:hypothetical protein